MSINVIPIIILMYDREINSSANALTIDDIMAYVEADLSRSTVATCVDQLIKGEYVAYSKFKKGKSYAYYLTEKGIELYKQEIE